MFRKPQGLGLDLDQIFLTGITLMMDTRLDELIDRFIRTQLDVLRLLSIELSIDLPKSPGAGHVCRKPENRQKLKRANVEVFPHGCGLCFKGKGVWIDFDFGENGELGGFDAHRLFRFNQNNKLGIEFSSADEIGKAIQEGVKRGEIIFSGLINYYVVSTKH